MYGFSDHPNPIPLTRLSALRQGSSRYSARMAPAGSIEQMFDPAVRRLTLPMPTGPRHVHCYLVRGDEGWTLVDTGLGLGDWPELPVPVDRIFVTHMHPDHVGGAERASAATGAPVQQGRLDYAQCERVWGS